MLLALLLATAFPPAETTYTRPNLLLEAREVDPAARRTILDARPAKDYAAGHIPAALSIPASDWAKSFATDSSPAFWEKELGGIGLDTETPVLVYDAGGSTEAARVWWILRFWGFKDVRLLNGGWKAWTASGGEVQKMRNRLAPMKLTLTAHQERLATKDQLLASLKGKEPKQILDVRSGEEHCGEDSRAKRGGTIPGAKHLEWKQTIDPKTGKFRSADELTAIFRKAGVDPKKPATTFCQSGGRAAVMAFVLELMGGPEVRNYYRSWAEWGNASDTPVLKQEKK